MPPIVSVLMASFNHSGFIGEAIESVVAQTFEDWELIIVDDCSTDDSLEVIQKYCDPRIHVSVMPKNSGGTRTYNEALSRSTGQLIMALDSDDSFAPDKMVKQVKRLESKPDIGVIGAFIEVRASDADTHDVAMSEVDRWFNIELDLNNPENWIWANRLVHSSTAITRVTHDLIGPARQHLTRCPDWDLWLRALSLGVRFSVVQEPLTRYRVQAGSVTHADPTGTCIEYLSMSDEYWHEYLRRIDRSDLVTDNLAEAMRRYVDLNESERSRVTPQLTALLRSSPEFAQLALDAWVDRHQTREAKDWLEHQWRSQEARADDLLRELAALRAGAANPPRKRLHLRR